MTTRHENIAKSLQVVTEEIILHLLNRLHAKAKCANVCLTGGVAMNSVANGKITRQTPFENVYVPAGAADNGTSFGAAFYVWNRLLGGNRGFVQDHAYWGCESNGDECAAAIRDAGLPFETHEEAALLDRTTDLLLDGKVVGWFQGKMEFGARRWGTGPSWQIRVVPTCATSSTCGSSFANDFAPLHQVFSKNTCSDWFEINEPAPFMERVFRFGRNGRRDSRGYARGWKWSSANRVETD